MRKVLAIAGNSLLRSARDRKALIFSLLMPMILIAILGQALKGMMGDGDFKPFTIITINEDRPAALPGGPGAEPQSLALGRVLVDDVLGSDGARKVIKTVAGDDLEQAREAVKTGKAVALVHIPPSFSADLLAGRKAAVKLLSDPGHQTQSEIAIQVVRGFTDSLTGSMLAARTLPPEQLMQMSTASAQTAVVNSLGAMPRVVEAASGARNVTALQYYAASMSVMFMLMTALGRAGTILEDLRDGTLARILVSPTSKATLLSGLILGTLAVLLAQLLILMAGTHYLFGVYWGPLLPALGLGVAFAFAAGGIATAAAGFFKDPRAADTAVGVFGNIFAALSGGMMPLYIFPEPLKLVAHFVPNYWALQGFLDQMSGVAQLGVLTPLAILAAIGLGTGALGTWRLAAR